MRSNLIISHLLLLLLVFNQISSQTAIVVAKKDLIDQFKNSEIPRIYNDIKDIKLKDKSQSKRKGFIRWHYSLSACQGQLSEFNASQVEIILHEDSNSVQINLRNFKLHLGCNASVKALIRISGSFTVDATIPSIHLKMTPGVYSREKGLKSILFHLLQSDVSISPRHDIKFRLHIKNCPRFIQKAIEALGITLFSSNIKKSIKSSLRKAVERGLQRLADKLDLQTVIPDTQISLTYSFQNTPKITNNQIYFFLESYFYPFKANLVDGKIPVPSRFKQNSLSLPSDGQENDSSSNSYLFYNQNLINSGLEAAIVTQRTYIVDNKFMSLFNSKQVINTKYLRELIPEIDDYSEEDIEVSLFLVRDQNCNTVKFGQNRLKLNLKFQSEILIKRTSQEIMTLIIQVDLQVINLRGQKGDGEQRMINVYGQIEDIVLKDFKIISASNHFTQETYDNMENTIETFFIVAQALVNKDIMRYPYWIPVNVLNIVKVQQAQAYLSQKFGLITAQISGN